MQIVLFKRDLRLQDSVPLFLSMKGFRRSGAVLPLYIHEPSLIQQPDVARQHQCVIHETLDEMAADIQSIGGKLLEQCGEAVQVLEGIHARQPITKIWTHRETTQSSQYARDARVRAWCRTQGIELHEIAQDGVARGSESRETFPDYFTRAVQNPIRDPMGKDLSERFADLPVPCVDRTDVPLAAGKDKPGRHRGGRKAAMTLMDNFFQIRFIQAYPSNISSPNSAWDGASRLSTYLAYGIISDREIFQRVDRLVSVAHGQMSKVQFDKFQSSARFYLDRLGWRRNYLQTFEDKPHLETECMLPEFEGMRSADYDQEAFERWKQGRTGFPYIDAAMRCLDHTGWQNMRLRATVVSFATMNLWIPTTDVARFLARQYVDYSPGIHHTIHQIVAGTTSFESMMVYNPVKQGEHDPQGHFVRRWVPELSDLKAPALHEPAMAEGHCSDKAKAEGYSPYPPAVVDHKATAKFAREQINRARMKGDKKNSFEQRENSNDTPRRVQQSLF